MTRTAVLGDSHGSEGSPLPPSNDDEGVNGGVESELGDSWVDDKWSKAYASQQDDGDEDDGKCTWVVGTDIWYQGAGACTSNLD